MSDEETTQVTTEEELPRESGTGRFVKKATEAPLVHPALRKKAAPKRLNAKMRRTTVRTVKLLNHTIDGQVEIGQYPIEPSFNNGGNLNDPTAPLRYYLDQGLTWPHESDELLADGRPVKEVYPGIVCAVKDCWDQALVNTDFQNGTERCAEHEEAWKRREVRYATSAK
jgi:hypothetical protein